jgi:prepilin-type N-terminal cleavage/methylation domain-containing protein
MRRGTRGFTLLEVVVAVGVFAFGIVVVIGMFAPLARSVGQAAEAETAAGVAELLKAELTQRVRSAGSFQPVLELLTAEDGTRDGTQSHSHRLFANRGATKLWQGLDAEKFFEITVTRNAALSPSERDDQAIVFAYTARISWPAGAESAGAPPQVILVNGSLRR